MGGSAGRQWLQGVERGLTFFVALFAGWTLLCHFWVFIVHGSFATLRWAAVLLSPLALLGSYYLSRQVAEAEADPARSERSVSDLERVLSVLLALVLVGAAARFAEPWIGWALSVLLCVFFVLRSREGEPLFGAIGPASRVEGWGLLALAVAAAGLTLAVHRPDSDDGFLLNLSVALLDLPDLPVHGWDHLHDVPGPMIFAGYRAHAVEVLYAAVGWVLGIEPIVVAHLLLPPLSAALAVCSAGLLLRVLVPRVWLLALVVLGAYWLAFGDVHEGFANYALVRLFQGKCVMVTVTLPYIALQVIRFMSSGRPGDFLRICAGLVAAIGLSSSALFVAPLALGVTAVGCWRPSLPATKRLALSCSAAIYPLIVALAVRAEVLDQVQIMQGSSLYGRVLTYADSRGHVLGAGWHLWVHQALPLAAAAGCRRHSRKLFLSALLLCFYLVPINPILYPFWSQYVTSAPAAWRLWWAVPIPILMGVAIANLGDVANGRRRLIGTVLALLGLEVFILLPAKPTVSARNMANWRYPSLKVVPLADEAAQAVADRAPAGTNVLVPRYLSMWLTTRTGHPKVVAHKENYLKVLRPSWGDAEVDRRLALLTLVSGTGCRPGAGALLQLAIEELDIGAVALHGGVVPCADEIRGILSAAGFSNQPAFGHDIWVRIAD